MPIQTKDNSNSRQRPMSKKIGSFWLVLAAFALILQFFTFGSGQGVEATIKISKNDPNTAEVSTEFLSKPLTNDVRPLWFLDEYAGIRGLTDRLSTVFVYDKQGYLIARKKFTPTYSANRTFIGRLDYSVNLRSRSASAAAHISWLNDDEGLLMLDDLLPQSIGKTATIRIELPAGWSVFSSEAEIERGVFDVKNVEKGIFVIGRNWRGKEQQIHGHLLKTQISGEWRFDDTTFAEMAGTIFTSYSKLFDGTPSGRSQITMFRMPKDLPFGRWEAETRGSSVVITSSDMPFETQSKQRLHEQLRHEMFHLWIPNGVNLSGNYDWFYEGFSLYQSLRMGVLTNRIRFDDFLDTLSRAITTDRLHSNGVSLIDASKNRFGGANTTIYARGMVVAFLCDLAMLERSKGKRSVENVLRQIYQKHHNSTLSVDGNDAVLAAFAAYPELVPIIDRYIKKGEVVDADNLLHAAGIEAQTQNSVTSLKVSPKPNSRQKDLLDKLGYNTWRKLAND